MTYTLEELNAMSSYELQMTIAELAYSVDEIVKIDKFPLWPTDISAAYELEEIIYEERRFDYIEHLFKTIQPTKSFDDLYFGYMHATPRQRCIAWILTMEGA